jgi:hypothetical protein
MLLLTFTMYICMFLQDYENRLSSLCVGKIYCCVLSNIFQLDGGISTSHHQSSDFEFHSRRGVLDTLYDKVCQWLVTGRLFSLGTPASSTNKTNLHYIVEIFLKGTLNIVTP